MRLVTDQNFNHKMLHGLMSRVPDLDIVAAQDAGLSRMLDPELLAWAAAEGRILVTHDLQTVPGFASARIQAGEPMPGVFVVPQDLSIGRAIEELTMIVLCSHQSEWENLVVWLPL